MPSKPASPERGPISADASTKILLVEQPKSAQLNSLLSEIEQITEAPTDTTGEDGSSSGSITATGTTAPHALSPREAALAALPDSTAMQNTLKRHIEKEIFVLRKEARRVTRLGRPGHAYHLNEIYRKIRQLRFLLMTMLEASYEVLRRLFVRIIIDRQPIL